MPDPKPRFPWSIVAVLLLSATIGWLLVNRPDKILSEPLPPDLRPGDPLVLEVLVQHDGPGGETQAWRRDTTVPVGARVRLRVTVTEVTGLTVGVKPPTGHWTPVLTNHELPPGVHTFRKVFVVEGEGLEAMAGTPAALEALVKGEPAGRSARRIKVRGSVQGPQEAPASE
ncbi:MAG: hypothetical protein KC613_26800 [Myxococcales bacterium]|nr:hypothetical protein [Myxococcales bacterium]MCB9523477.1 hypothetical protein [Myxococcales bacterium]